MVRSALYRACHLKCASEPLSGISKWCNVFCFFSCPKDSQRSHLSTITMILKDKFHSPKIKRTPSKKGKQAQPEPAAKSAEKPANKVSVQVFCYGKSCRFFFFNSLFFLCCVFCFHILLWKRFSAVSHSLPNHRGTRQHCSWCLKMWWKPSFFLNGFLCLCFGDSGIRADFL